MIEISSTTFTIIALGIFTLLLGTVIEEKNKKTQMFFQICFVIIGLYFWHLV